MQQLQKDESLPFRVRCLLKDVLDNRAEKWRKKFAANKEGPTRLSELHQQAQLEQLQQQHGVGDARGGMGGMKGRAGFDGRGMVDDNGWEMAPSTRRGVGAAKAVSLPREQGVGTRRHRVSSCLILCSGGFSFAVVQFFRGVPLC